MKHFPGVLKTFSKKVLGSTLQSGSQGLYNSRDEKSDFQNIFNPVPKCKCHEGNKFAIVQICVQMG